MHISLLTAAVTGLTLLHQIVMIWYRHKLATSHHDSIDDHFLKIHDDDKTRSATIIIKDEIATKIMICGSFSPKNNKRYAGQSLL